KLGKEICPARSKQGREDTHGTKCRTSAPVLADGGFRPRDRRESWPDVCRDQLRRGAEAVGTSVGDQPPVSQLQPKIGIDPVLKLFDASLEPVSHPSVVFDIIKSVAIEK